MSTSDLTTLLHRWQAGDLAAESAILAEVYPALRAIAHRQLAGRSNLTLQPTELAHEAYFRLAGQREVDWQNRGHFFSIAARIVRRVVIDYLRARSAQKRGSNEITVSLDHLSELDSPLVSSDFDWLQFDQVLGELESVDAVSSRIVELRYFVGLSLEETAAATDTSRATVVRQWRTARAWLHQRLEGRI